MKQKNNKKQLTDDISIDEILNNIDMKIQEIESGKKTSEKKKTRIDGVDTKDILKKLDDKYKQLKKQERKDDK